MRHVGPTLAVIIAVGCDDPPGPVEDAHVDAPAATDLGAAPDANHLDAGRPDAGRPDAVARDVPVADASRVDRPQADVSPWMLVPADCSRTFNTAGPAARRMRGYGRGTLPESERGPFSGGEYHPEVTLAFPSGRVAGAEALLAYGVGWPINGTFTARATLDATGGARFVGTVWAYPSLDLVLHPDGSLDGEMGFNVGRDDVVVLDRAAVAFCVAGDVPAPTASLVLRSGNPPVAPDAALRFTLSSPLARETTAALRVSGGSREVPLRVATTATGFDATPERALPFGARITVSDLAATDELGRPFTLTDGPTPAVLETTAVLSDRGFGSEPSPGAIVSDGARFRVERGVLHVGLDPAFGGISGLPPGAVLVGLGDVGAARRARLEFASTGTAIASFRFRWIAADGAIVDAGDGAWRGEDAGRRWTYDAALPSGGAWWLSITTAGESRGPGPPPPPFVPFELDAIVVE